MTAALIGAPLAFSVAEGLGLDLITTVGYLVAGIFFLDLFKIWPLHA